MAGKGGSNTGVIILVIFCFCLLVGGGITAGLYYGNVTCPSFGADCSAAPGPSTPGPTTPGPTTPGPTTPGPSTPGPTTPGPTTPGPSTPGPTTPPPPGTPPPASTYRVTSTQCSTTNCGQSGHYVAYGTYTGSLPTSVTYQGYSGSSITGSNGNFTAQLLTYTCSAAACAPPPTGGY